MKGAINKLVEFRGSSPRKVRETSLRKIDGISSHKGMGDFATQDRYKA
jgi:hypothetical protein